MAQVETLEARSFDTTRGKRGEYITPSELIKQFPKCIWVIPDGNRRAAKEKNLSVEQGHKLGSQIVVTLARVAQEWGIEELTFWAFSQDNWKRPRREIKFLMEKLLPAFIDENIDEIDKRGARLSFFGDREYLRKRYPSLVKKIEEAEERTVANTKFRINVLLNYDGSWHTVEALNRLKAAGVEKIDKDQLFAEMKKDLAPADLLIRTSGEMRLSGIESPLTKRAELIFPIEKFPDYNSWFFLRDLYQYTKREQRYGQ